jgi:hypothetical protein
MKLNLAMLMAVNGLTAFAQPQLVIAPSPSPALSVTPLDPGDPAALALAAEGRAYLQPVSVITKNIGTQPILSILVLATSTGPDSTPITGREATDALLMWDNRPVLKPGDSLVAIPNGGFHRPGDLAAFAASPGGSRVLQTASDWVGRTGSELTISVDAVVLESGEVDGPDTTNYMSELQQRKEAAESVLAAINGPSPEATLSQMAAQKFRKGDWLAQWQHQWAGDYLAASRGGSPANVLTAIRSNLGIPQLFHGAP